ncbi:hypothetical protein [Halorientalis marina]|uniref:hypothetical protein n=1 Tax=Halorientalis marina TaxID=2931976 RepID=UPI001FF3D95C|nr:hypothetical protein [Halorientalis marina]
MTARETGYERGDELLLAIGLVLLFKLLRGRIADRAAAMPDEQRLLHWKAWKLLWFLIAMLIVFALLSLVGIYDISVLAVLNAYLSILIRVAFALFLVANVGAVEQLPVLDGQGGGGSTTAGRHRSRTDHCPGHGLAGPSLASRRKRAGHAREYE